MQFWTSGIVLQGLLLAGLLLIADGLRRAVDPKGRLGVPASIAAGTLGLLLGPSVFGVLPLDTDVLESAVYHGLGLVFVTVALQQPPPGRRGAVVTSMAFAIPTLAVMQGLLGLLAVLLMGTLAGSHLHPGFGLVLPMGFSQGPGQALSLGSAWETSGMTDGAQVGLIVAALGFAWAVLVGVPLVAYGRYAGWLAPVRERDDEAAAESASSLLPEVGALEGLTRQAGVIGVVYLVTYGIVSFLAGLVADEQLAAMIYGFHFIIGAIVGLGVRIGLSVTGLPSPLDDRLLHRLGALSVDITTCAALAAVQISVLAANWMPILAVTVLGGTSTLLVSMWVARRAFPEAPFEHAVVMYGAATGTLPTGLALLRIIDPDMRTPAASSAIMGAAGAIVLISPLMIIVLPMPAAAWPDGYPAAGWMAIGMFLAYLAALLGGWRLLGPLRAIKPWWSLWPKEQVK